MSALGRFWLKPRGFWLDGLPVAVYFGFLFWGGLIPLKSLPGPDFALLDKAWHLVAFGGLTGLAARAFAHFGRRPPLAARDAALAAAALGGLLEVLQSFTPYRSAEWGDFLADSIGAALVYVLLRWLQSAGVNQKGAA